MCVPPILSAVTVVATTFVSPFCSTLPVICRDAVGAGFPGFAKISFRPLNIPNKVVTNASTPGAASAKMAPMPPGTVLHPGTTSQV